MFNASLKVTPEEQKHFVDPAFEEANKGNFAGALDVVTNGLNAHAASEGLLMLRAFFGYKQAETMSNELTSLPRAIDSLGEGLLMVDGASTVTMLARFQEIARVLGEAGAAIDELLQVNPGSQEILDFKAYIEKKLQRISQQSENMRLTFSNTPNIAGKFCLGCRHSISFENQKVVFRRVSDTRLEVWHLNCYQKHAEKTR